ncbi:MAG: hypothetical protein Q8R44_12930 [Novosphingobium sp.]|nr:hypothetical protein [Novosphingobium sp.]
MTGFFQMRGGISVLADGHGELELIAPYLVRIEAGLGSQYARTGSADGFRQARGDVEVLGVAVGRADEPEGHPGLE